MAGLLALPDWWPPSRPYPGIFPGWNSGIRCLQHERITAAGTAPDFPDNYRGHRIPLNPLRNHFGVKIEKNYFLQKK